MYLDFHVSDTTYSPFFRHSKPWKTDFPKFPLSFREISEMTKLPKCPKCGRVFSWRYYYIHVKKCKGRRKEKQKKLNGFLSEDSVKDSKKSKRKDKKRGKRKKRR